MASAMAALAAAAAAAVRPGERRWRRHDCWGWDCAPVRTFQKSTMLNENKQGRISQRRRINGCEVTTALHLLTAYIIAAGYPADGMDSCAWQHNMFFFINVSPTLMLPASILMYLHLDLSWFAQCARQSTKYECKLHILHRWSDAVWQQRVQEEERVREKLE